MGATRSCASASGAGQFLEECTPGYYNNEGKPSPQAARNGPYGAGSPAFFEMLSKWRAEGGLAGLELR